MIESKKLKGPKLAAIFSRSKRKLTEPTDFAEFPVPPFTETVAERRG